MLTAVSVPDAPSRSTPYTPQHASEGSHMTCDELAAASKQ